MTQYNLATYQPELVEIVRWLPFRNTLLPSQSSAPPPCQQSSECQRCTMLLDYLQRKLHIKFYEGSVSTANYTKSSQFRFLEELWHY